MATDVLIGTQGWRVGAWAGPFYPRGTRSTQMLEVYGRAFRTVEVGSTAFAIPAEPVVREWAESVPDGFLFSLKVPQQVTHERRLQDTDRIMRRFVDRAALLGDKLGALLVQLSPGFRPTDENASVLHQFLATLPDGFRWAVEFRHAGWMTGATATTLRHHGVATVLTEGRWVPRQLMSELALEPTADFGYVRWEGTSRRFKDVSKPQAQRDREFETWTEIVGTLGKRTSLILGYFDDQFQGHAPHSARTFQSRLGQEPVPPTALRAQAELF